MIVFRLSLPAFLYVLRFVVRRTHHAEHVRKQSPTFRGWAKERVAWSEGSISPGGGDKIVSILSCDPPGHIAKARDAVSLVERELGMPDGMLKGGLQGKCSTFLYISRKKIIGVAVAEPLQKAFRAKRLIGGTLTLDDERDGAKELCLIGIRAIWVNKSERRRGVARKILDAVRRTLIAGFVAERNQVAFTQPTVDGSALASAYSETDMPLVYQI